MQVGILRCSRLPRMIQGSLRLQFQNQSDRQTENDQIRYLSRTRPQNWDHSPQTRQEYRCSWSPTFSFGDLR